MLRIGHACNAAKLVAPEGDGRLAGGGDPTEGALLVAARKAGLDRQFDLRLRPVVRRLAFEAKRKRMSTIHRALPQEGLLVAYVKGAALQLLEHCTQALVNGREVPLTQALRDQVIDENDRMARAGLRVLGMAYHYLPAEIGRASCRERVL